jgi:hypothetical protein
MDPTILLVAFDLAAAPEAPSPTPFYPPTPVAGWIVLGLGKSCGLNRDFPGGARLSFNMASDRTLYLVARNPRWQGIEHSEQYLLSLSYDGRHTSEIATGFRDGDGGAPELGLKFMSDDAYDLLRTSGRMTFSLEERVLGSFPLAGLADGLKTLEDCAGRAPRQSQSGN